MLHTDNLSMPADIIKEGKLSALQLEAIVYGCQRHQQHLPAADPNRTFQATPNNAKKNKKKAALKDATSSANKKVPTVKAEKKVGAGTTPTTATTTEGDAPPANSNKPTVGYRKGFLVGDGAGMGKGRTLAGFVLENNSVGRKRHIWVSVSSDLYDDAKRGKYNMLELGVIHFALCCHNAMISILSSHSI